MFFGYSFASDDTSFTYAHGRTSTLTHIEIKDVIADELYVCRDAELILPDENGTPTQYTEETYTIPYDTYWDRSTAIHAQFNGDIDGGNIKIDPTTIQAIKLKRRIQGNLSWQTIYYREVDLDDEDPFNLDYMDYTEPSENTIEYVYTFVIDGIDRESIIESVYSQFNNYFIVGAEIATENGKEVVHNTVYQAMANAQTTPNYNRPSATIVSPGSKYPYVINNGVSRYYSGNFTAVFFNIEDCCNIQDTNAFKLRKRLDEFLADGNTKLLKKFDGDMWLIQIVGNINRSNEGYWNYESQNFDWAEVGNPYDIGDLYDNAFILTDMDRRK